MSTFPTGSRKANFSDLQEVLSGDLNAISTYLHQIIKDRNVNLFTQQEAGYSPGCIVNGCQVSLSVSGVYANITVGAGLLFFAATVDTNNYNGTLLPVVSQAIQPVALPAAGKYIQYSIDINYSEFIDGLQTQPRNFYDAPTDLASSKGASTYVSNTSSIVATAGPVVSSPGMVSETPVANGWARVANFVLSSTGVYRQAVYELPYIWNMQSWPGTPNSGNSDTTNNLAECLSAVRAQLKTILGMTNWFDVPAISLTAASNSMTSAQTAINSLSLGLKGVTPLYQGPASTFTVPANCYKLYIKMWGPGGNGGNGAYSGSLISSSYAWGGGGGAGAYIEDVFSVIPGQIIPYRVGSGGSGVATTFGSMYSAGAGGAGGNANTGAMTDGAGGGGGTATITPPSDTAIVSNGKAGSQFGYGDGTGPFNMPCIDYFSRRGKDSPAPLYGCGGGGCCGGAGISSPVPTSPGGKGGDGLILVYYS